jgi:hypothetical protein
MLAMRLVPNRRDVHAFGDQLLASPKLGAGLMSKSIAHAERVSLQK